MKTLIMFIEEEFEDPTQENITKVCLAAINLFSSLKAQNSTIGGIV